MWRRLMLFEINYFMFFFWKIKKNKANMLQIILLNKNIFSRSKLFNLD